MNKINKGYKVFISYKYKDSSVKQIPGRYDEGLWRTTARNYVDIIQEKFEDLSHINKGEKDGEDFSNFKDETIASKLRDKIYDRSRRKKGWLYRFKAFGYLRGFGEGTSIS